MPASTDEKMSSEADRALALNSGIDCPGFESSRVFALTASLLQNPPPGGISPRRLIRNFNAILLFVVHPTQPISPANPRTRPQPGTATQGGGALRPAYWYADLKKRGVVRRGQPSTALLGRKKRADVVVELRDRDLVNLATGQVQAQKLFNEGRIKVKGDLDLALRFATFISHERSKLYGDAAPVASKGETSPSQGGGRGNEDYEDGAPAPSSGVNLGGGIRARL